MGERGSRLLPLNSTEAASGDDTGCETSGSDVTNADDEDSASVDATDADDAWSV